MPEVSSISEMPVEQQARAKEMRESLLPENVSFRDDTNEQTLGTKKEKAENLVPEAIDTQMNILDGGKQGALMMIEHHLTSPNMENIALHALPADFKADKSMLKRDGISIRADGGTGFKLTIPGKANALLFRFGESGQPPCTPLLQNTTLLCSRARVGVVFGNAPTIDTLPKSLFRLLERPVFATAGVNRCCISKSFQRADFAPTINVIQDGRDNFKSAAKPMIEGLRRWAGKTWRICCGAVWPNDQTFYKYRYGIPSVGLLGAGIGGVHHHHSTPIAAVEFLYRMGIRDFYIYGVELKGPHFKMDAKDDVEGLSGQEKGTQTMWKHLVWSMKDARFYCASKTSLLVSNRTMPFAEL